MSLDPRAVAEAFSGHRFAEAYPYLAPDVRWEFPGDSPILGRDAVIEACDGTLASLTDTKTEFDRFVVVADERTAAVDVIGRYVDADGSTSIVASCDIYEFDGPLVKQITSYAVEVQPR